MEYIKKNNQVMIRREDGFFNLGADKEAIREYENHIKQNLKVFNSGLNRLKWLVENNYYYNLFEEYTEEEIVDILNLSSSYKHTWPSYMAISKFYESYALKTNDKKEILETFEEHNLIVSLYLARGDIEKAKRFLVSLNTCRYQPATPTYLNAGRKRRGEMVSCFLLTVGDSLNAINHALSTSTQLSKIGGGVALDLTRLRARGESIKDIKGVCKGVVPVAKMLEVGFSYANQLGQREGAGAVYLNIFHYDILDLLDSKKINADEKLRLTSLSIGVIVPDLFIELAKEGKDIYMFGPHSVLKEYGVYLDEINIKEYYERLVENPNIFKRKVSARELLNQIASTQLQSGYPYLMFIDNANKVHALKDIGMIKMSNLCSEIMQLQEHSTIRDYEKEDTIKRDISCNLGSLNITNVMESKNIKEEIYNALEMLTSVSDMTDIPNAPSIKKANKELHSVGLGAMNLNGYLAKNHISYESEEAKDFCNVFFMMMNYYTLKKSMYIARDRKEVFKDFEQSEYAKGAYFDRYIEEDIKPQTEKVRKLFEGIKIPNKENWCRLKAYVSEYGLYHAYRIAIAPTQSISYIQNATSSVMPVVDLIERRLQGNLETFYPMPYLSENTQWYYKSAYHINQYKMIDLISVIQSHVDQGISTILFVTSNISTRELSRLYVYAHFKGLKSLYYTRNKLLSLEECLSCSV